MPELLLLSFLLLSFNRAEFRRLHKAATQGDEPSLQEIEAIWQPYRDRALECLLCGSETAHPPFCMMLPDPSNDLKLIGAPLCASCRDLPDMVRWHRPLKRLGKMHKAETGKQAHFNIMGRRG